MIVRFVIAPSDFLLETYILKDISIISKKFAAGFVLYFDTDGPQSPHGGTIAPDILRDFGRI